MEQQELDDYRDQLINSLENQPHRMMDLPAGGLQVFVNHESVGFVDCMKLDSTFSFCSRERGIHTVEMRNESGVLVGGLCAAEVGLKSLRISTPHGSIDLHVHNRGDGGSFRMRFERTRSWWSRLATSTVWMRVPHLRQKPLYEKAMACAQIVLVVGVLTLLAVRFADWSGLETRSPMAEQHLATQEATQEEIKHLQQQVALLAQTQQAALKDTQSGQEHLAHLNRLFENVSQAQSKIAAQVVTTQEDLRSVKEGVARDIESGVRVALTQDEQDRHEVRQEVQAVKSISETLIKQVALLESKNRELHARLALTAVEVAKVAGQQKSMAVARTDQSKDGQSSQLQVAESLRETDPQAFQFWVSFQDGTSEKSIEDLFHEIKGTKKGPSNSGWYPVEVKLPKPEPPDRFLESIKRATIVKAVTTSTIMPPAQ